MAHLALVCATSAITMLVYNTVAPLYPVQSSAKIPAGFIG